MNPIEVRETHQKLRNILQKYGNEEFGDCIVDDISTLFNFPTTIDIEKDLLEYSVEKIEDNLRYIKVWRDGILLVELECLGGFLTNEEEIQNWLDDNGYEDVVFEFIQI